jgi:YcaO-like protein with predicted kinase domain
MRPFMPRYGITRLARQTGLDVLGIPCFAAIRPNARTLSVNMGKGVDDAAAMASAVMEATEYAIAEAPEVEAIHATVGAIRQAGREVFDVSPWLPQGHAIPDDLELSWLEGRDLFSGSSVFAPRDALIIGGAETLADISQSTNGLASGNSLEEATFHALCELVERDATTLWIFKSDAAAGATRIEPRAFADPLVGGLARAMRDAGFNLTLFDQTTAIGLPVIFALLSPAGEATTRYFDLAAGCGCHPVAARAAIRAITEAAQTRVSNIAGARDDFDPAEYHQRLSTSLQSLLTLAGAEPRRPPAGLPMGTSLPALFAHAKGRLVAAGITRIAAFPLGGDEAGIAVVRLLAHGLEDRSTNRHWRPGPRATGAMLGLW